MITEVNPFQHLSNEQLQELRNRLRSTKINVLLVGGTGVGKSSTINALFQDAGMESRAVIGQSTKPETIDIEAHELDNLVIWDTPGLGDSPVKDQEHSDKITEILHRKDSQGKPLIDLVFLILDAGSRDFSSAFTLIKEVILPNLHEGDKDRLLIGLNQADQAMKGHYWNKEENKPDPKLVERLEETVETVRNRIKNDTGLDIEPIYYSAGCIIEDEVLSKPYNLAKILSIILARLPKKKRAAIAPHISENRENFRSNDNKENYQEKVDKSIFGSLMDWVKEVGGEIATKVGEMAKDIVTNPDNIKTAITIAIAFFKKK